MRIIPALLLLGACSQEPRREEAASQPPAPPVTMPAQPRPAQSSALMAIPEDPQAVQKLEAMGYTIHEDHLHAPGVTSCPKMGNDPVV